MDAQLQEIGLTPGEIRVYYALLELGETTKTSLAKNSGIAPSNIYDVTNRLLEKGIISRVIKNGVAHFSAAHPQSILRLIDQKEEQLAKEREHAQSILPKLIGKYQAKNNANKVEMFQGWSGIKTVFEEMIEECDSTQPCYVFGAGVGYADEQTDRFFLKYSTLRANKGIKTSIIFNEEVRERKERINFFKHSSKYEIKFLRQSTPAEIMLYENKTCIIILIPDPIVIRIIGEECARSFRQYFDSLWNIAEK